MKFVDEIQIIVQSGCGGSGCVSFRRERFIPKGGPDGGTGGCGGNVILKASTKKQTLHHLKFNSCFRAGNGKNGQGAKKTGRAGKDLIIEVPVGTVVIDSNEGNVLKDLVVENDSLTVAKGGKGGCGNTAFKSSTNRVPRFAQSGESGCFVSLKLELKFLADVGIIGLPNAGKSTFLSTISSAKPKIGNYPFTTITPNLGIVNFRDETFAVADIPGLIKGAHQGSGLGTRFLRHIERTSILVHLVDISEIDLSDPLASIRIVNRELTLYNKKLIMKPRIFVLSKMDSPSAKEKLKLLKKISDFKKYNFLCVSSLTSEGIHNFVFKLYEMLKKCRNY